MIFEEPNAGVVLGTVSFNANEKFCALRRGPLPSTATNTDLGVSTGETIGHHKADWRDEE